MSDQKNGTSNTSDSIMSENAGGQVISLLARFSDEVSETVDINKILESTYKYTALLLPSDAIFIGLFSCFSYYLSNSYHLFHEVF